VIVGLIEKIPSAREERQVMDDPFRRGRGALWMIVALSMLIGGCLPETTILMTLANALATASTTLFALLFQQVLSLGGV